jgi:aminoglycoside phosphotransferase
MSDDGSQTYALKVAHINRAHLLEKEYRQLKKHCDGCTCSVLVTPQCSNISCSTQLCGYLMAPVGDHHVSRSYATSSVEALRKVLRRLLDLHTHEPPIIHGDARLPNLLQLGETLFWVDMLDSYGADVADEYSKTNDMRTLISSILHPVSVPADIDILVRRYGTDTNEDAINNLVSNLFAHIN